MESIVRNVPVQVGYGDGGLMLDYSSAHVLIQHLHAAVAYMVGIYGGKSALKMQLPLPLHAVLLQITGVNDANSYTVMQGDLINLCGIECLPGYEARIIIYNPREAFYSKRPMAIIDFDAINGVCQAPILRVV
jgi:hypothetical protein